MSRHTYENIPFLPPPPPPPLVPDTPKGFSPDNIKSQVAKNLKSMLVKGGDQLSDTWLREARRLVHRLNTDVEMEIEKMFYCCASHFIPIVQEGPQCGLVCLSMASKCFPQQLTVGNVMETAKHNKYTLKGEMFSAGAMLSLGKELLSCDGRIIKGNDRRKGIIEELLNQSLILVPYDRDCNNEPCLKNGRKSHWALLTGILFSCNSEYVQQREGNAHHLWTLQKDEELPNLHHVPSDCVWPDHFTDLVSDVHVFAQQGKSLRTHLWPIEQVLKSNEQLTELDPEIVENIKEHVIPEGGVAKGLKDQVVCFQRVKIAGK